MIDLTPFWVSIQLGLWATAILFLISVPLAWIFVRSRRLWVPFVESLCTLPLVVAPTVMGFFLLVVFSPKGVIGQFLENTFGLQLVFTFPGLVLAMVITGFPFMLGQLKTGIQAVDHRLWEASYTLGKGPWETLIRVVLPNMQTAILGALVMTFAHSLGEFGVVLMIGGSIPGVTQVVSVVIYEKVEAMDFATAQIYALVLIIFSYGALLALSLLQRFRSRR